MGGKEAKSWLINFPEKPISEVWLIKAGEGKAAKLELTAFTEPATLTGTTLVSLANEKHETEEAEWGFSTVERKVFPHWYSGGRRLRTANEAAGPAIAGGTGTGTTFSITDTANMRQSKCKMTDTGKIYNPPSGVSGAGQIRSMSFSNCTSSYCATNPELEAGGTPWSLLLFSGSPIKTQITNMKLSIKCNGVVQGTYTGTVEVKTLNGLGRGLTGCTNSTHTTWLEFVPGENELTSGAAKGVLEGKNCIWGELAEERIEVGSP